jgi:hypothetical protein
MRDNAARVLLRADDDDMPRDRAELRSVDSIEDAYAELRARATEVGFERTSARRFQAADHDLEHASEQRFQAADHRSERRFERRRSSEPAPEATMGAVALAEPAVEPRREPVRVPRTAPGRSYGAHRRGDDFAPSPYVGRQPGRRTVEITGQVQAPRRPSPTSAALMARPDRTALWAFLFALFLLVMAVATASG